MMKEPSPPRRWRIRWAAKTGLPQLSSSWRDAALATRQRVSAALGSAVAPLRKRSTVTPLSPAAKASRRLATRSRHWGMPWISKSSAPTCGQARMSLAADKASAAWRVRTRISCPGSPPNSANPLGDRAPYSIASYSGRIQKRDFPRVTRNANRMAKPPALQPSANTSCRAPGRSPPPRTASACGWPSGIGARSVGRP